MVRGVVRAICGIVLLAALAGCGAQPDLVPYDGPVTEAQQVFVASARRPDAADPSVFGTLRTTRLRFADYRLSVPPERTPGQISAPEDSATPDPARDFLLASRAAIGDAGAFVAALNARLAELPPAERDVMIFVHGYWTSFEEAVLNAAEIATDYHHTGPMVVFSWPSDNYGAAYLHDRESALIARDQLAQTLQLLAASRARSVTVLAHSLGGFVTMEALDRLNDRGDSRSLAKISRVWLPSPDIDLEVFQSQLRRLDPARLGLAVMASDQDLSLGLATLLASGHPRVGEMASAEALRRLGVAVIDVSAFAANAVAGHYVFQRAPGLMSLMASGALDRALANARRGERLVLRPDGADAGDPAAVVYMPY